MSEKAELIQKFIELCESAFFPHREELLRGIENGEYLLVDYRSTSEIPSKNILDTYKFRAKHLAERLADKKIKGKHAQRLKRDSLMFVNELEKVPDDKVNVWEFSIDEVSHYLCFEGVNSKRILGCILGVDRRKVSESEWEKLWSE